MGNAVLGLQKTEFIDQFLETFAVFGQVNCIRAGAENGNAGGLERGSDFQRRLAAELHDHAMHTAELRLAPDHLDHIFVRQRLEIQPVRGVVVGRHRLRIAVYHNGLIAGIRKRVAGMDTAVVELDALTDPVGATAKDHHLVACGRRGFAFGADDRLVGRIHIGRLGSEFGGTGVNPLVDRMDACGLPRGGGLRGRNAGKHRHSCVGKPHRLECLKRGRVARNTVAGEGCLGVDDDGDALKEPFVPSGDGVKFIQRHAGPNCLRDPQNAEGNEFAEPASQRISA